MNPYLFTTALTVLIYRAVKGGSLTGRGIAAAIATALVHGAHPWAAPFLLLVAFYSLGTAATKAKHGAKAALTVSSTSSGSSARRGATQVFANSLVASVLTALHAALYAPSCFAAKDLLVVGIVVNYAAVTADTLSSELGMLSRGAPRLVTTLRPCARGTNGGVSLGGVVAGAAGAAAIGLLAVALLPFCSDWSGARKAAFAAFVAVAGTAGSLLDSLLGALLQETVVDVRSGKVVEAPGGGKVLVSSSHSAASPSGAAEPSRKVVAGYGLLSNNGVNFVMALLTSLAAMGVAGWWWHGDAFLALRELVGACGGNGFCAV
ncbi:integral membrane protein DUF92-domain-containing protein [Sphaerosporella brunnea]|uniref:Integral membrane protein DUF92-domain-containing protein n=1 Tax=Sphaerosporella brunnea TaxID=1250544 RepID=A0A5J5EFP2_9PEZI|nr:integral membrane protein DUF92-domain-containing protein [Sphaerosporella brunnea]